MQQSDWERISARIRKTDPDACWDWVSRSPKRRRPYAKIGGKVIAVPRAILEHTLGRPIGEGLLTRHLCGNHLCCNPSHLCEGTAAENHADMMKHGRYTPYAGGPLFLVTRLMAGIDFRGDDECWPWTKGKDENGYGRLRRDGKNATASRLMLEIHLMRPLDRSEECLHECDNPSCCNPAHLKVGTHKQNFQGATERRRVASGERHPHTKLTEAQVIEIRARYAAGEAPHRELAEEYGVSRKCVQRIVLGTDWRYAGGDSTPGMAGLHRSGERSPNHKLTRQIVASLREEYATGKFPLEALGPRYGITPENAKLIVTGRTWKKAGGPIHSGPLYEFRERPSGEGSHRAKLTNTAVKALRERYAAGGVRMVDLAAELGMVEESLRLILKGRTYPDAGGPLLKEDGRAVRWCAAR